MNQSDELELTWKHALAVWWLIVWRSIVGAICLGFAAGFVLGFVMAIMGVAQESITLVGGTAGAGIGLLWGIFVVKMALKKRYSGFRLMLVPTDD